MMDSEPKSGDTPAKVRKTLSVSEAKEAKDESPFDFMLIKMKKGEKKCYVRQLLTQ